MSAEHHIDEAGQSRALVPLDSSKPSVAPRPRRAAPFLAQLIATRAQAPQTRLNRRAEPAEAIACYRAVARMMNNRAA